MDVFRRQNVYGVLNAGANVLWLKVSVEITGIIASNPSPSRTNSSTLCTGMRVPVMQGLPK